MSVITLGRGQILVGNYLLNAYDVEMTPHSSSFEFFESYEGVIGIKKQLDQHTELKFKANISESNLPNWKSGDDPSIHRADFIELRRTFLDEVDGQLILVASSMFKPFKGYISVKNYKIDGGYTDAEFSIEIREAM